LIPRFDPASSSRDLDFREEVGPEAGPAPLVPFERAGDLVSGFGRKKRDWFTG
jgi:hypothetical protein